MTFLLRRLKWLFGALCLLQVAGVLAGPAGPVTWGSTASIGGGWGRMVRLPNGHWLCVTTRYPSGTNSFLRIHRSTNDCRNWTTLAEVAEDGRTLDNGELIALPNGTVLLTMRSLIANQSYRLPVYASTNNGATWSYRSIIDVSENLGGKGLWEPDFWVLDDGRLVVTYSNEKHTGYSQVISERVSTDNGASWGAESWPVSQPGGGSLRPGMSQMAHMANGKYILVYEVVNSGNADVHYKISNDGVNWPAGLGTKIPCQHCGPFVTSLPNGLLMITSCENQISISEDFGGTWEKVEPPAWDLGYVFSWPAIYVTRTNEVGVMVVPGGVKLRFGNLSPRPRWPNPFQSDFDSATDVGWSRYGGNFEFNAGRYLLNNEGTNGKAMTGDGFWRDGVLEADLMISTPGNAGVMFRTMNPDYTGPDDAFGYYAGLDTGGSVILGRMSNAWNALASAPMSVGTNVWHHLKVNLSGSQIQVFVDNMSVPKITFTDATFRRGQIGVRAFQCDAQFDNVTFSNAVPLKLSLTNATSSLRLAWPETSVSVKPIASANLGGGEPLTNMPVNSNSEFQLSLEPPSANPQFYWLEAR